MYSSDGPATPYRSNYHNEYRGPMSDDNDCEPMHQRNYGHGRDYYDDRSYNDNRHYGGAAMSTYDGHYGGTAMNTYGGRDSNNGRSSRGRSSSPDERNYQYEDHHEPMMAAMDNSYMPWRTRNRSGSKDYSTLSCMDAVSGKLGLGYTYYFVNQTSWVIRIVLEDDPEGILRRGGEFHAGDLHVGVRFPHKEIILRSGECVSQEMKARTIMVSAAYEHSWGRPGFTIFKCRDHLNAGMTQRFNQRHIWDPEARFVTGPTMVHSLNRMLFPAKTYLQKNTHGCLFPLCN